MIDALDAQSAPITRELRLYARRQAGCRALMKPLRHRRADRGRRSWPSSATRGASPPRATPSATPAWTSPSTSPTSAAPPGHLSRQGPPALRWALFEAAQAARRPGSPDRAYYDQAAERLGGNRACLALARKLLKRSFHTLRELGDEALQPA